MPSHTEVLTQTPLHLPSEASLLSAPEMCGAGDKAQLTEMSQLQISNILCCHFSPRWNYWRIWGKRPLHTVRCFRAPCILCQLYFQHLSPWQPCCPTDGLPPLLKRLVFRWFIGYSINFSSGNLEPSSFVIVQPVLSGLPLAANWHSKYCLPPWVNYTLIQHKPRFNSLELWRGQKGMEGKWTACIPWPCQWWLISLKFSVSSCKCPCN